jgi:hypothetical protein
MDLSNSVCLSLSALSTMTDSPPPLYVCVCPCVGSARICSQRWEAGIVDQWLTPPFFAWVAFMCWRLLTAQQASPLVLSSLMPANEKGPFAAGGASGPAPPFVSGLAVVFVSWLSYFYVQRDPLHGFDHDLALHTAIVVALAVAVMYTSPDAGAIARPFLLSLCCLIGFAGLKLTDHALAERWPVPFRTLTGHFWSKVADFGQIHYAFEWIAIEMAARQGTHPNFTDADDRGADEIAAKRVAAKAH